MSTKPRVPALSGGLTLNPDRPKKPHPLVPDKPATAAAAAPNGGEEPSPAPPRRTSPAAQDLGSLPEGTAMLSARVPKDLRNAFKSKVAERGMKVDQVVRALLTEYVERG